MSLTYRAYELAYQLTVPASLPTAEDYPVRCEVSNALSGLFDFTIGNIKGLATPLAQFVLVVLALALIVVGVKNSGKLVRGILFALGGLLLLTVVPALVSSFGSSAC
jgi:hypothetical protein